MTTISPHQMKQPSGSVTTISPHQMKQPSGSVTTISPHQMKQPNSPHTRWSSQVVQWLRFLHTKWSSQVVQWLRFLHTRWSSQVVQIAFFIEYSRWREGVVRGVLVPLPLFPFISFEDIKQKERTIPFLLSASVPLWNRARLPASLTTWKHPKG